MTDILERSNGRWILRWDKYPHDMLALLIEAHKHGYESEIIDKATAFSLKVRLQKMTSGIRNQADVPQEIEDAANDVVWCTAKASNDDEYRLVGKRRDVLPRLMSIKPPQAAENELEAILARSGKVSSGAAQ